MTAWAISIRQPLAWLIVNGWKVIENRDWSTKYRGPILIHASKTIEGGAVLALERGISPCDGEPMPPGFVAPASYQTGGIVGAAELVDCVTEHASRWFVGEYGFVLRNARALPFEAMRGQLGIFQVRP